MSGQIILDIEENRCKYPFFYCMRTVTVVLCPTNVDIEDVTERLIGVCLPHAVELTNNKAFGPYPISFIMNNLKERFEL